MQNLRRMISVEAQAQVSPSSRFLIEREGDVRILNVNQSRTTADAIVNMVPEAIDRISAMVNKTKEPQPAAQPAQEQQTSVPECPPQQ